MLESLPKLTAAASAVVIFELLPPAKLKNSLKLTTTLGPTLTLLLLPMFIKDPSPVFIIELIPVSI